MRISGGYVDDRDQMVHRTERRECIPARLKRAVADVKTPEILKACSSVFTAQGTSLKGYLRVLMRSKLYQLEVEKRHARLH